ncbi:GNAT family N-acetyltransferase [Aureibaculum marinum]|uniref:GNAT family N-acetyltransferase n=1 Tax=Aureibaculum marinum TaxID=2487930 RepID=A0A3N4P7G3_9FLAO|nr:GNAT family N-acetyltransferase [Aureibaculum marinum]RPD99629.1 GNAT family N-acetyltransferase [Aureibaculum marinum]
MIYRKATQQDLESLSQAFNSYRMFYQKKADVKAAYDFLLERICNNDSEIYVALNDDKYVVGFIQLYPLLSSTRMKKYWLLNDLFVVAECRGQGISVKLIEMAKDLVRSTNACGMYLETEKRNKIGNNLYSRSGFKLMDDVNFYEWTL